MAPNLKAPNPSNFRNFLSYLMKSNHFCEHVTWFLNRLCRFRGYFIWDEWCQDDSKIPTRKTAFQRLAASLPRKNGAWESLYKGDSVPLKRDDFFVKLWGGVIRLVQKRHEKKTHLTCFATKSMNLLFFARFGRGLFSRHKTKPQKWVIKLSSLKAIAKALRKIGRNANPKRDSFPFCHPCFFSGNFAC